MFDSPERLFLGLVTGILFGFLLQKGRVTKFSVIIGQFILRDWTVAKVMGTAIVVGSVGVHALVSADQTQLHIKPFLPGGVVVGGICFGLGMAIYGYCPGTGVGACGEGKPDALAGVVGMLVGALAFVVAFPALQPLIKGLGDLGKQTLPEVTGTSPWLWVALLVGGGLVVVALLFGPGKPSRPIPESSSEPTVQAGSHVGGGVAR